MASGLIRASISQGAAAVPEPPSSTACTPSMSCKTAATPALVALKAIGPLERFVPATSTPSRKLPAVAEVNSFRRPGSVNSPASEPPSSPVASNRRPVRPVPSSSQGETSEPWPVAVFTTMPRMPASLTAARIVSGEAFQAIGRVEMVRPPASAWSTNVPPVAVVVSRIDPAATSATVAVPPASPVVSATGSGAIGSDTARSRSLMSTPSISSWVPSAASSDCSTATASQGAAVLAVARRP